MNRDFSRPGPRKTAFDFLKDMIKMEIIEKWKSIEA